MRTIEGFSPADRDELKAAVDAWSEDAAGAAATYGDISEWDTSAVTDMSGTAWNVGFFPSTFDGDVSAWDTSAVTTMAFMFYNADAFNGDVSAWDTSPASPPCSPCSKTPTPLTGT